MEDMEELHHRRLRSSSTTTSTTTSFPKFPPNPLDLSGFGGSPSRFPFRYSAPDSSKRSGIPPIPPSPSSRSPSANATPLAFHSRSLSQPAFFSLDSLPPLSPQPPPLSDVAVDDRVATSLLSPSAPISIVSGTTNDRLSFVDSGASFPPLKAHRRSLSDVPFGGFFLQQPSVSPVTAAAGTTPPPVPLPLRSRASVQLVKQESEWEKEENTCGGGDRKLPELDVADDLVNAYMNLDVLEGLNSSGAEDKREDLESSRFSGTRTTGPDSSENEAESSVNESVGGDGGGEKKEGRNKRTAVGDLEPVTSRHCRSLSMDSLMGKLHFGDESPKFPLSPGNAMGLLSHSGSLDGKTCRLEHGNGSNDEFNSTEMKKIMANEKLAEMALTDPKRVKRILANRQSAARSKERKMRYISELEHKVQTLQTEATTLSTQLTLLQRDSVGLTSQNNELKFRLQAMEQQAQLKDALNEALAAEVQRLKLATGETNDAELSKSINQQMQMSSQIFKLQQLQLQQHQQQSGQTSIYQLQSPQQQQQQQQQNDSASKLEPSKC